MKFSAPFKRTPCNPQFQDLVADKLTRQYFMKYIGMEITHVEAGYVEAEVTMQPYLKQQDGMVHGGVTATVSDIVTGLAAFTLVEKDDRVVTSDLKISYFSPGQGEKVFARGWVLKPGRRLHYCEAEIYSVHNDEYKMIAKATAIMAVIQGKNKEMEK